MTSDAAVAFLSQEWSKAGVGKGDMLLLHSNTRGTLRRLKKQGFKMDVETILDSFLYALGEEGTLLLPLFNFEFCAGKPFDIRTTLSRPWERGVLAFEKSITSADMEQTRRLAYFTGKAARSLFWTFPISTA
jgi:aminoglycoside N3'-acetyltransferase